MTIKITPFKRDSKSLKDFRKKEWKKVHKEHFGTDQNDALWQKQKFNFKTTDGGEIIGNIKGNWVAGVMYIDQLIAKDEKRRQGVGNMLMKEAESLAKKNYIHKIYLKTGVGWKAVKFYESLGFKEEATIKDYYDHKDFWIMSKFI